MLWRLGLASTSTLDSLLARELPPTLEQLMDEPDILTECKAQNNRLIAFLSKEDSCKSLLQWVVAGLDELDQAAAIADSEVLTQAISSPDLYPSYKAPTPLRLPGHGPGSPPLTPTAIGEDSQDDTGVNTELSVPGLGQGLGQGLRKDVDDDLSRSRYPTTATEILTCNEIWIIADTIIRNADTLLTPFWDAVLPPIEPHNSTANGESTTTADSELYSIQEAGERERARNEFWSDKDEERDRRREIIRGLWMRVNSSLLAKRGPDMFRFIQTFPNAVERIVARISSPAIQSLLVTIISSEEGGLMGVIDWLAAEGLVPRLLGLLSSQHPSTTHVIVADLIKQIISLCAPSPFNPQGGNAEQQAGGGQGGRDNKLIRELVSEKSVEAMVNCMLEEVELTDEDWKGANGEGEEVSPADPFITHPLPSIASATSSLISICTILVEIIRRNNSDFSEPHLFHTLRNRLISVRVQEDHERRERGDFQDETEQETEEKERRHMEEALADMSSRMGIVHLGHLLSLISEKFERLHHFMLQPRSQSRVTSSSNSKPFTLERFHILELYAELLHSSNMSVLNRLPGTGPTYTDDGILSGGLEGLEALGEAIEDNDNDQNEENAENEDDHITKARELPVSESGGCSLAGSDDVESEDEDVLEAIDDDAAPSPSPGGSSLLERVSIVDLTVPPPTQEVTERLRGVMETESKAPSSSAASDVTSVSHIAVASSTAAPSIASDLPEAEEGTPEPRDLLDTPHVAKIALPSFDPWAAPGATLKKQYLAHQVLPTVVNLFFGYPHNDFMHHVVYDIVQQIFNGKLSLGLNRDMIVQIMTEGRLVERVLDAQRLNDGMVARPKQPRLPYMGHVILIAEELVKFFSRCPPELYELIKDTFVQSEWQAFVDTSLQEAKDRDDKPLAGGKPAPLSPMRQADSASEDDDDDDDAIDGSKLQFGEPLTRTSAKDGFAPRGEFDQYADHDENGDGEDDEEAMDRYWKSSGIGLGRRSGLDSSDEDDDDADWLQPPANGWSGTGDDDDFGAWETGETRPAEGSGFDDDAWGDFSSGASPDVAENPFGDDNFAPSVIRADPVQQRRGVPLTPLDWAEQFDRAFRENGGDDVVTPSSPTSPESNPTEHTEDDKGVVPIIMPSFDEGDGDDVAQGMSKSMEFSASTGTSSWTFEGDDGGVDLPPTDSPEALDMPKAAPIDIPISPRKENKWSSGSYDAGSASSSDSSSATATSVAPIAIPKRSGHSRTHSRTNSLSRSHGQHRPHPGHPITSSSPSSTSSLSSHSSSSPASPRNSIQRWGEAFSPPDPSLIAAATEENPLGPGVSRDTRITEGGMLEREVDGKQVRVPQDEIVEAIERNADDMEMDEEEGELERVRSASS